MSARAHGVTGLDRGPSPIVHGREHTLETKHLALSYDGHPVISELDLALPHGRTTAIVGANACGKSTLLRGIARLMRPDAGAVELDGRDLGSVPTREVARVVGILPQSPIAPEGITVRDLVTRGRYPHRGWFQQRSGDDDRIVTAALTMTSSLGLADRKVEQLSGGQRQRVWIAMALAQDADILLLDEPTTFLDVAHQLEVLDLLLQLNREQGTTVVMVLHDLNLAARYADNLVLMSHGEVIAAGEPSEVITAELVRAAFGLEARVVPDPVAGSPMVVPIGRFHGVE